MGFKTTDLSDAFETDPSLQIVEPAFRGRVMGVRMLAVYGLPLGLFASSGLITWLGFAATASIYACIGLAASGFIAYWWRDRVWQ